MPNYKQNPLKALEAFKHYPLNAAPINRIVAERLILQKYLGKSYSMAGTRRIKKFFLNYRGEKAQAKNVLPGWENNRDEVMRIVVEIKATEL